MKEKSPVRIIIVASVPGTIWAFYRPLIERLVAVGWEVTVASSDEELLYKLNEYYQCKIVPVKIKRKMSLISDMCSIVYLIRYLKNQKFDILHAHSPKGGMIGLLSAFLTGVPNRIYTMHGFAGETSKGLMRSVLKTIERLNFKLATLTLIVSESLSRKVMKEKICRPRSFSILADGTACGINRMQFNVNGKTPEKVKEIRQKHKIPMDAIVVGFVGRLVPDKGIECLIKAMRIIQSQYTQTIYLMLVGPFETVRDSLSIDICSEIENSEYIITCGQTLDVVSHYYAMDMLVLPSRREGFNYVLLEAAACGLPTVTTKATGCVDAVVHNETGLIIEVDDHNQLAESIKTLIDHPQLRIKFGQQGEQRVEEKFNADRLVREHMNLYVSLLNQNEER